MLQKLAFEMNRSQCAPFGPRKHEVALLMATLAMMASGATGCLARRASGGQCSYNSDCDERLRCAGGYCREECREDRDCPAGASCQPGGERMLRVCLLPESERLCDLNSDCPPGAFCDANHRCRASCREDRDCVAWGGGVCQSDGRCSVVLTVGDPLPVADAGADAPDATDSDSPLPVDIPITDMPLADRLPPPDVFDVAALDSTADAGSDAACPTSCGARCVDLQTDSQNCGSCGRVCMAAQLCFLGACVSPTPSSVAAGGRTACAIVNGGSIRCWGDNAQGQVGSGAVATTIVRPEAVRTTGTASAIAVGGTFACALLGDSEVRCWGDNRQGQLGDGTTVPESRVPTRVMGLPASNLLYVFAGSTHACVMHRSMGLFCWGDNRVGQCGLPTSAVYRTAQMIPVAPPMMMVNSMRAALGSNHSCAVLDAAGRVGCWGQTYHGVAMPPHTPLVIAFTTMPSNATTAVALGDQHGCLLRDADGAVFCWGSNANGQLGNGTVSATLQNAPSRAGSLASVAQLALGSRHSCAVRIVTGGRRDVQCWGQNSIGQLGNGTTTDSPTPVAIPSVTSVSDVSAGDFFTCIVSTNAVSGVLCWGDNTNAQLTRSGSTPLSTTPIAVAW